MQKILENCKIYIKTAILSLIIFICVIGFSKYFVEDVEAIGFLTDEQKESIEDLQSNVGPTIDGVVKDRAAMIQESDNAGILPPEGTEQYNTMTKNFDNLEGALRAAQDLQNQFGDEHELINSAPSSIAWGADSGGFSGGFGNASFASDGLQGLGVCKGSEKNIQKGNLRWAAEEPNILAHLPIKDPGPGGTGVFMGSVRGYKHHSLVFQSQVRDIDAPYLELAVPWDLSLQDPEELPLNKRPVIFRKIVVRDDSGDPVLVDGVVQTVIANSIIIDPDTGQEAEAEQIRVSADKGLIIEAESKFNNMSDGVAHAYNTRRISTVDGLGPHPRAQESIIGPRGCDIGGWYEMMLYQARCIRWFKLNCICDYNKTFLQGSAESYVLLKGGASFHTVAPYKESEKRWGTNDGIVIWPLAWRGVASPWYAKTATTGSHLWDKNGDGKYGALDMDTGKYADYDGLSEAQPGDFMIYDEDLRIVHKVEREVLAGEISPVFQAAIDAALGILNTAQLLYENALDFTMFDVDSGMREGSLDTGVTVVGDKYYNSTGAEITEAQADIIYADHAQNISDSGAIVTEKITAEQALAKAEGEIAGLEARKAQLEIGINADPANLEFLTSLQEINDQLVQAHADAGDIAYVQDAIDTLNAKPLPPEYVCPSPPYHAGSGLGVDDGTWGTWTKIGGVWKFVDNAGAEVYSTRTQHSQGNANACWIFYSYSDGKRYGEGQCGGLNVVGTLDDSISGAVSGVIKGTCWSRAGGANVAWLNLCIAACNAANAPFLVDKLSRAARLATYQSLLQQARINYKKYYVAGIFNTIPGTLDAPIIQAAIDDLNTIILPPEYRCTRLLDANGNPVFGKDKNPYWAFGDITVVPASSSSNWPAGFRNEIQDNGLPGDVISGKCFQVGTRLAAYSEACFNRCDELNQPYVIAKAAYDSALAALNSQLNTAQQDVNTYTGSKQLPELKAAFEAAKKAYDDAVEAKENAVAFPETKMVNLPVEEDARYRRHIAYVESVHRDDSNEVAWITVSEWNWGKNQDSCGNTDRWRTLTTRKIFKSTRKVPENQPCDDPDWAECYEYNWDRIKLYRPTLDKSRICRTPAKNEICDQEVDANCVPNYPKRISHDSINAVDLNLPDGVGIYMPGTITTTTVVTDAAGGIETTVTDPAGAVTVTTSSDPAAVEGTVTTNFGMKWSKIPTLDEAKAMDVNDLLNTEAWKRYRIGFFDEFDVKKYLARTRGLCDPPL